MQIKTDQDAFFATLDEDDSFYLRRRKRPNTHLTDLNFGTLDAARHADALHHFMVMTGGWPLDELFIAAAAVTPSPGSDLRAATDRMIPLLQLSLPRSGILSLTERVERGRLLLWVRFR